MVCGKRLSRNALFTLIALLLPSLAFCATDITGKVRGADGGVPDLGHVHLMSLYGDLRYTVGKLEMVELSEQGAFKIMVEEPGMYRLGFTAVDHTAATVPLIVEADISSIKMNVRLAPINYLDDFETVRIIGSWKDYSWRDADTMNPEEDGTYSFRIKTEDDTVGYELLDVTDDAHSVNGTHSDWHIYDGGGDYISIVKTEGGEANIVFDPGKVLRSDRENLPLVEFGWRTRWLVKLWEIESIFKEHTERFEAGLEEREKEQEDALDFDWAGAVEPLMEAVRHEKRTAVKEFAAIHIAQLLHVGAEIDSQDVADVIETMPVESTMWEIAPWSAPSLARQLKEEKRAEMLSNFVNSSPVRTVRAWSLAELTSMAAEKGDMEGADAYYERLKTDHSEASYLIREANPRRRIKVGKLVPDFRVKLMESGETVSSKNLSGKYYLLDFWATWCGPCRGEMKYLHEAYEDFKDRGLTMISLSFDEAPGDVKRYRKGEWKMPWLHAFVDGGFSSNLATTFEVVGIPKPVLVGPDGTILAVENDLRGWRLKDTLDKHLTARE